MENKWVAAYVYLLYLFLATLPQLTNTPGFSAGTPIFVLIALYLAHSYATLGRNALKLFLIGFLVGLSFEALGVHTGVPFGEYYYTGGLGPKALGVPIIIPLLWATLAYFAYLPTSNPIVSSWYMVLVDLTVDPLFSKFDWHWVSPGQYFGVPTTNFVSWYAVSLLIYVVWRPTMDFKYNYNASIFMWGLILNLALQDYFAGLTYPALISTAACCLTPLALYMFNSKRHHGSAGRKPT
jgi:putative membrane protein